MENLKLNSKIEIINQDEKKTLGIIHDIVEDKIIVSIPSDDKSFILLQKGEKVNCIAYNKTDTVGFYGEIVDRIYKGMPVYVISNTRNFKRIQRRQDVRVPVSIDMHHASNQFLINNYGISTKKELLKSAEKYLRDGIIADISGGGMKFSCYDNFPQGKILLLIFNLDDDDFLLAGTLLHKEMKLVSNKTLYTYGVKFNNISERDKERIIRYIFKMMRIKGIR